MDPLLTVLLYFVVGAGIGLATYSKRHLFGEGPSSVANADPRGGLSGRIFWVLMNTCLWPVSLLAGLYGWLRRYWK